MDERLLTTPEAAATLGLSPRTMEDLRWKGAGPRYLQLSRNCIRYRHGDLIQWAEAKARFNTSHPLPLSEPRRGVANGTEPGAGASPVLPH